MKAIAQERRPVPADGEFRRPRLSGLDAAGAASGLAAGTTALMAGEIGAKLLGKSVPPLQALGDLVIRATPIGVTTKIIDLVGEHDKTLLRSLVLVVAVLLTAAIGVAHSRGYRRQALAAVGLLGLAPVAAVASAPSGRPSALLLIMLPATVLGGAVLHALSRPLQAARHAALAPPAPNQVAKATGRRQLLRAGGLLLVVGVVGESTFRALSGPPLAITRRLKAALPAPISPLPAVVDEFAAVGASPLITPLTSFYRVDIALTPPLVDPNTWRLDLSQDGERLLKSWTYDEILSLATTQADITIGCIDNKVGGDLIGTARWQGVLLSSLLESAGVTDTKRVAAASVDGFVASFPGAYAFDGRPAMLAVGMNGQPLPIEHGFPARLVVPGLYGFTSAVKWITALDVSHSTALPGFWADRGWTPGATVKITSRIDSPASSDKVPSGTTTIAGVAWAPVAGVGAVEVRINDAPWQTATLSAATTGNLWRQFALDWTPEPGTYLLTVRAADQLGTVQDSHLRDAFPSGATGLHTVRVHVV